MSARLIDVKVDWHEKYANSPTFEFKFDREVERDQLMFRKRGPMVVGVDGDAAIFHSISSSPKTGGYGNSPFTFHIQNDDGSYAGVLENVGAWSSRAGCVNNAFPDEQVVGDGRTACRLPALLRWVKENPDCGFRVAKVRKFDGEIYYEPCGMDGHLKDYKSSELLEYLS